MAHKRVPEQSLELKLPSQSHRNVDCRAYDMHEQEKTGQ